MDSYVGTGQTGHGCLQSRMTAGRQSRLIPSPAKCVAALVIAVTPKDRRGCFAPKLHWLAEHEPEQAARAVAVCLPHDWLTWRLGGAARLDALTTDRGDVSGTGHWSRATGNYRSDLLHRALGAEPHLSTVLGPADSPGRTTTGAVLGAGSGDNAAAALGLGAVPGYVVVSFGTSGVVKAVALAPAAGPSGSVAGFADATGNFLPLARTLNAARVLDAAARLLGGDHDALSRLALSAPARADGLVVAPYLEGSAPRPAGRHPCGARAAAGDLDAGAPVQGGGRGRAVRSGGWARRPGRPRDPGRAGAAHRRGARSVAVRQLAPSLFGCPVLVPPPGESRRPRRGPAAGVGAQRWRGAPRLGAGRAPRRSTPIR